jgi:hypothetical protein
LTDEVMDAITGAVLVGGVPLVLDPRRVGG